MADVAVRVWRGGAGGGGVPPDRGSGGGGGGGGGGACRRPGGGAFQEYGVPVEEGMVVLDVLHRIQAIHVNDLAIRWNCKAGKCGSCSAEGNGHPRATRMTPQSIFAPGETVTVAPTTTFPLTHKP